MTGGLLQGRRVLVVGASAGIGRACRNPWISEHPSRRSDSSSSVVSTPSATTRTPSERAIDTSAATAARSESSPTMPRTNSSLIFTASMGSRRR